MDIHNPIKQEIVSTEQMDIKPFKQEIVSTEQVNQKTDLPIEAEPWQYSQCIKSEMESSKITEKPYSCKDHNKSFTKPGNLSRHISRGVARILSRGGLTSCFTPIFNP